MGREKKFEYDLEKGIDPAKEIKELNTDDIEKIYREAYKKGFYDGYDEGYEDAEHYYT